MSRCIASQGSLGLLQCVKNSRSTEPQDATAAEQIQQSRPLDWDPEIVRFVGHLASQALWAPLQGVRTLSAAATEPLELHDAIAAERFQQGSVLDWDPEVYRAKTGGGIPRVLHHIFLDGEHEYDRWVTQAL